MVDHPPFRATPVAGGGLVAGVVLAIVVGVVLSFYVVAVTAIAWRTHRHQDGFENNLRLLELLLAALPWRRHPEESPGPVETDGAEARRTALTGDRAAKDVPDPR
ncbi:hypothetical protein [Actinomadura rayongensis]|uniref:Uncharacterized protein n=1 Tax=Actinomadura rayongensis TaxID=1429076 RepID=A0A6I4W8F0_9ACTN|nr:hypothetical protein [Actinomadura rayongensis]MXQ67019.1 hypothetical protein [Actinomadura rayongensis]